ncbi:YjcZ family sporulation protein [Paenibacillus kribbensis]|nr:MULTISPECIES: YjcZ family sporulation protein [Paenibacillus]MEC0235226.1 YjcZ family sporulation protein [Paenibacillus kribbensis]
MRRIEKGGGEAAEKVWTSIVTILALFILLVIILKLILL